ncbi:hypothetical protein B0H15DRAFT_875557 [Mycena belliarum]|uniref:Uncharacterized protein n=1 Tax=Mycena belliarum TaxID=1033014 RepID=A0AAD6UKG1_9AGAR|nr:hypothetical protein B0H15DRAFT_875557 [Mycena belliae]
MSTDASARPLTNGKRRADDPSFPALPLSDQNFWFYPSLGVDSDDEEEEEGAAGPYGGNWGAKTKRRARWARRGKITSWGPGVGEWEEEERARKRMKLLLPPERRSPSPPSLAHLARSVSPPIQAPYPPPTAQHLSYSSFVLDKAVTHTFRATLLDELEHATNGLIEGEGTMRRALGRLWQVISEDRSGADPDAAGGGGGGEVVPKREEDDADDVDDGADGLDEVAKRVARAPDLAVAAHRLFLWSFANGGGPPVYEHSHFASPETQREGLEKSLATLRELQDDGREYTERLEEIREGLGDVRTQRDGVWTFVRERAVEELQEVAFSTVV